MTSSHRGVALYIAKNISYIVRTDLTVDIPLCKSFFIEVTSPILPQAALTHENRNNIVGAIYYSPSNGVYDFVPALYHMLDKITGAKLSVILLGDINTDTSSYTFITQAYMTVLSGLELQQ